MGFNSGFKGLIDCTHQTIVNILVSVVSSLTWWSELKELSSVLYRHFLRTIPNILDDWLTVHHSITFLSPTCCTKFLFIYI